MQQVEGFEELDLSDIQVEDTSSQGTTMSEALIQLGIDYLKNIRDSYIRLQGLNLAMAHILYNKSKREKENLARSAIFKKMRSAETDENTYKTCKVNISNLLDILEAEVAEEEETQVLNIPYTKTDRSTASTIANITGSIPSELGNASYTILKNRICENHNNVQSEYITLEEKKEVIDLLKIILCHCTTSPTRTNAGVNMEVVADVTVANQLASKSPTAPYMIPEYDMRDKIKELDVYISLLEDSEVTESPDTPNLYFIRSVSEVEDLSTGKAILKFVGEIFLSNEVNVNKEKVIKRPVTFDNQMHLIGICKKDMTGENENLISLAQRYTESALTTLNDDEEVDIANFIHKTGGNQVIRVPYCILGQDSNGKRYAFIGIEDTNASISALENYKNSDGQTYLDFLHDAVEKRSLSNDPKVWCTTLTASSITTPGIVAKNVKDFRESAVTRFTDEELFRMVKNKNIKEFLINDYSTMTEYDVLHNTQRQSQLAKDKQLISKYRQLTIKLGGITSNTFKYGFTGQLTPTRSAILQLLINHFQTPIVSRLELETMYNNHKDTINHKLLKISLARIAYERDNIGRILGDYIYKDSFFEYIVLGEFKRDQAFKLDLNMAYIYDTVWFMTRLHSMGISVQDFKGDDIKYETDEGSGTYTKIEFVKKVAAVYLEADSLLECWGVGPQIEGKVGKTSSVCGLVTLYLYEAYMIYSMLLSDQLQDLLETKVHEFESEGEDTMNKHIVNMEDIPYAGYEEVESLVSKEYYDAYVEYMNNRIISPIISSINNFKNDFDSHLLINQYIKILSEMNTSGKELSYFLTPPSINTDGDEALEERYKEVIDYLESGEEVDEKHILELIGKVEFENVPLFMDTLRDALNLSVVSTAPLTYLLPIIEAKSSAEFTEQDLQTYYCSLGLDHTGQDTLEIDYSKETDFTVGGIQAYLQEGAVTYVARDEAIFKSVLKTAKFKSIAALFAKAKTEEEWKDVTEALGALIKSKVKKYTQAAVEGLEAKIGDRLRDAEELKGTYETIKTFTKVYMPNIIDANLMLTALKNTLVDATNYKPTELNLTKLKLENITKEQFLELDGKIKRVVELNEIATALYLFVPPEVTLDLLDKKKDCIKEVSGFRCVEENILEVKKKTQKSTALYKKYLSTGDSAYLSEVDIDYVPFDLLTSDNVSNKILGQYAKINLIEDHGLVAYHDIEAKKEMLKMDIYDILEEVIASLPIYYEQCPAAIRDYIKHNRRVRALNN